jgi:hypothetical protein
MRFKWMFRQTGYPTCPSTTSSPLDDVAAGAEVHPGIMQKRQGHADIGIPPNRYRHLTPDRQRMAASRLAMVTMDSQIGIGEYLGLQPGSGDAGEPLVVTERFADLVRDKRLGALILGSDHANDPQILALARTGHPIIAIDPTNPDRLVEDILTAIGASSADI